MLYYILVKRLLAKKTTYFQRSPNYLIKFGPTGVRIILDRVRLHDTEETTGGEFPWALVDSDMKVTQPASCLLDSFTHVVYATSPKKERDSWAKHVGAKLGLTMKPWTWTELVHGCVSGVSRSYHLTKFLPLVCRLIAKILTSNNCSGFIPNTAHPLGTATNMHANRVGT